MPQRWDAGGRGVSTRRRGRTATNNRNSPRSSSRRAGTESKTKHRNCCSRRPLLRSYKWLQSPFWSVASTFIVCAVVFHTADATKLELTDCSPHDRKLTCLRSTSARTRFLRQCYIPVFSPKPSATRLSLGRYLLG